MKAQILIMFLFTGLFFVYKRDKGLEEGHKDMCSKLEKGFVEKFTEADLKQCEGLYKNTLTFKDWEKRVNAWLGTWAWSHLSVYSPQEAAAIWESESLDNGIRIKLIEDHYLVYQSHQDSLFKKGDVILEVNGKKDFTYDEALTSEGSYLLERKGKSIELQVKPSSYQWEDKISFDKNKIVVPSFRGEFFNDESLINFRESFEGLKKEPLVYIDLRDNYGGNIAAGLIFLSYFMCEENNVGKLRILSNKDMETSFYPIDINQDVQVTYLKNYSEVDLQLPNNPDCYKGEVKVLVNVNTSSTAELVAQAFLDFKRGELIGEQTSGRMVLSSWDPIKNFPEGFYISYPYALYESAKGFGIEKEGVYPDIYKTYVLDKEKKGQDSFVN